MMIIKCIMLTSAIYLTAVGLDIEQRLPKGRSVALLLPNPLSFRLTGRLLELTSACFLQIQPSSSLPNNILPLILVVIVILIDLILNRTNI